MEATKKKKAYLKSEMKNFEVKMEAPFLAASTIIIEPDDPNTDWTEGWLEESCTKDGVAKALPVGGFTNFRANKDDATKCKLIYDLNAVGKCVRVTRISEKTFRAEIVDSSICN